MSVHVCITVCRYVRMRVHTCVTVCMQVWSECALVSVCLQVCVYKCEGVCPCGSVPACL